MADPNVMTKKMYDDMAREFNNLIIEIEKKVNAYTKEIDISKMNKKRKLQTITRIIDHLHIEEKYINQNYHKLQKKVKFIFNTKTMQVRTNISSY